MPDEADLVFGKLAIKKGYLDEPKLVDVIRIQEDLKSVGIEKSLGEILREKGVMTPEQVEAILYGQKHAQIREEDRLYGEIAIRNGFCAVGDVREALAVQQTAISNKADAVPRIGGILRRRGKISEQQHQAIKKAQLRLGKPLSLVDTSVISTGAPAQKPAAPAAAHKGGICAEASKPRCSVCGDTLRAGAEKCDVCGTWASGNGKAADVATAEELASNTQKEHKLFGHIAVRLGFISEAQVEECIAIQRNLMVRGGAKRIGEIMAAKSYLSPAQVERILNEQLTARGKLVLDMGRGKKPSAPILAFAGDIAAMPAGPPARLAAAPTPARLSREHPTARGRMESFKERNILFTYGLNGLIVGGVIVLTALGYGVFKVMSILAAKYSYSTAAKVGPVKEPNKADEALKEAEQFELSGTGSAGISAALSRYSEIADQYPNTAVAEKALTRKNELRAILDDAQDAFRTAMDAARAAAEDGDHDKALKILEAFIERVSAMTGKPLLQDGKAYLDKLVGQAKTDFQRRLSQIEQTLSEGQAETAKGDLEILRSCKVLSYSDDCRRSLETLSAAVEAGKAKLEKGRAAAAAAEVARQSELGRKRIPNLIAESKELVADLKFAEAILGSRKAVALAGAGQYAKEAADSLGEALAAFKKIHTELLSALNHVRNWTVAKQYDKAVARCNETIRDAAFCLFHEGFQSLASELAEVEKSKGDHSPLLKRVDELQKTINNWADAQVAIDPSLRCATCGGIGALQCDSCDGKGTVKGPPCSYCGGTGKMVCPSCAGIGTNACATCGGARTVQQTQSYSARCPTCSGTGKVAGDVRCTTCNGRCTIPKTRMVAVPCKKCGGRGTLDCRDCDKGKQTCPQCRGRGSPPLTCTRCEGKAALLCPDCFGSGLNPREF